nr:hypothetical protein Itr_chr14CG03970 [Ipomoea trifida]
MMKKAIGDEGEKIRRSFSAAAAEVLKGDCDNGVFCEIFTPQRRRSFLQRRVLHERAGHGATLARLLHRDNQI